MVTSFRLWHSARHLAPSHPLSSTKRSSFEKLLSPKDSVSSFGRSTPHRARSRPTAQRQVLVHDRAEALLAEDHLTQVHAVCPSHPHFSPTQQIDLPTLLEAVVAQLQTTQLRQIYPSHHLASHTLADPRQTLVEAALTAHDLRKLGHRREVHLLHLKEVAAAELQGAQLAHYVSKMGDPTTRHLPRGTLLEGVFAEREGNQRRVARHVQTLALGEGVVSDRHVLQVLAACGLGGNIDITRDLQFLALRHGVVLERHRRGSAAAQLQLRHALKTVLREHKRIQVADSYA